MVYLFSLKFIYVYIYYVCIYYEKFNYYLNLDKNKSLHMYYSKSYKDKVICLKFSNNKNYIITRKIWNILKTNFLMLHMAIIPFITKNFTAHRFIMDGAPCHTA